MIYTKNSPENDGLTIGYSTGFRESVTFSDFKKYKGGKTDWLGFDDGTRDLPDNFPDTDGLEYLLNWEDLGLPPDSMAAILKFKRDKLYEAGRSFNKTWTAQDKTTQ